MKVLVACECSGRVRQAFRDRGHDAWSCDILPAEDLSEFHIQGDALLVAHAFMPWSKERWDLMIAHPPCTYLTNAGARWWVKRQAEQLEALEFVRRLMGAPIRRIAIENPPGKIGTAIRKADQYIHPWQFGHMETKTTGLWLQELPPLVPTKNVRAEMERLPEREKHRVHWMSPGPDRARERARTYPGIADAIAEQWGALELAEAA